MGAKRIEIYDIGSGEFIIDYTVSAISGKHIDKPDVLTYDPMNSLKEEKELLERYAAKPTIRERLSSHLDNIRKDRPRYYNASVRTLAELFPQLPDAIASQLLDCLVENKTINAFDAFEIADSLLVRNKLPRLKKMLCRYGRRGRRDAVTANLEPQRNDITDYDNIINQN